MSNRTLAIISPIFCGILGLGVGYYTGTIDAEDDASSEVENIDFPGDRVTCYVLGEELSCLKN